MADIKECSELLFIFLLSNNCSYTFKINLSWAFVNFLLCHLVYFNNKALNK